MDSLPAFLQKEMRPALRSLVGKPGLVGVEVGVWHGASAAEILHELNPKMLYLVDPYRPYIEPREDQGYVYVDCFGVMEDAFNNLGGDNLKKITWMNVTSLEAASMFDDNSLDFVYIDANHEYIFVRADIKAWYPKVKYGGILGGHDFEVQVVPGVKRAVLEVFDDKYVHKGEHDWWVEKKKGIYLTGKKEVL